MSGQKFRFPLIRVIVICCILGSILLYQTHPYTPDRDLLMVPLILITLLVICPPSVFRHLGQVAGNVKQAFEGHRNQPGRSEHKSEQYYEQGYQAYSSHSVREPLDLPDPYELPQAQYPQQEQPPM